MSSGGVFVLLKVKVTNQSKRPHLDVAFDARNSLIRFFLLEIKDLFVFSEKINF
jgi:hypothetical protein